MNKSNKNFGKMLYQLDKYIDKDIKLNTNLKLTNEQKENWIKQELKRFEYVLVERINNTKGK